MEGKVSGILDEECSVDLTAANDGADKDGELTIYYPHNGGEKSYKFKIEHIIGLYEEYVRSIS